MRRAAPDPDRPALRALESRFVEEPGRRGVVLSDPLGLMAGEVFLPEGLLPIVARLDGLRSISALELELSRELGEPPPRAFLPGLLAQLDEHLLLYSERFLDILRAAQQEFLSGPARPPRHAGSPGYPAEPHALRAALDELLPATATRPGSAPPRGLIAPHIDLQRGAEGYRAAYGTLACHAPPDLFVLFGTGHRGPGAPITGLPLDWDTPLGSVTTDRGFLATVEQHLGPPDPLDLFLHRDEHSLEFQILFLRHLYGGESLRVAAFLTGEIQSCCDEPGHDEFLPRLRRAFAEAGAGRTICFVAGADLAHVGPSFGDPAPVDPARLELLAQRERKRLDHLARGEPHAFHAAITANGNPDRVCGTAPIYLTAMLAGGPGQLLHYGQAASEQGEQAVTFCSMLFAGN